MLGQTIHWVTILINKSGKMIEILLFDSQNIFLLGSSREFIRERILKICRKGETHRGMPCFLFVRLILGRNYTEEEIASWVDLCDDIGWTLNLFRDCLMHNQSITSYLIHFYVQGFLDLFSHHVEKAAETKLDNSDIKSTSDSEKEIDIVHNDGNSETWIKAEIEAYLLNISHWLRDYSPPTIIEEYFIHHLRAVREKVDRKTIVLVATWRENVQSKFNLIDSLPLSSDEMVERIRALVNLENVKRFWVILETLELEVEPSMNTGLLAENEML